jgi:hypothetical protein
LEPHLDFVGPELLMRRAAILIPLEIIVNFLTANGRDVNL